MSIVTSPKSAAASKKFWRTSRANVSRDHRDAVGVEDRQPHHLHAVLQLPSYRREATLNSEQQEDG